MSARTRKNQLVYTRHTKSVGKLRCEFCEFNKKQAQVKQEFKHFWVVTNIFPYDLWDSSGVKGHLMVVPKRHVDSISHFTKKEQQEYTVILGKYEEKGYSVYARAPGSALKSVTHQHTHLIAIDNKPKRLIMYLRKPFFLIHK